MSSNLIQQSQLVINNKTVPAVAAAVQCVSSQLLGDTAWQLCSAQLYAAAENLQCPLQDIAPLNGNITNQV